MCAMLRVFRKSEESTGGIFFHTLGLVRRRESARLRLISEWGVTGMARGSDCRATAGGGGRGETLGTGGRSDGQRGHLVSVKENRTRYTGVFSLFFI